ncbi:GFA family protein [Acinetobacter haemolyticus]|uniref:GFA family protein n=1 Tax=Acinetobacter haemolyticus TaxID=29430 RepID=UPI00338EE38B
MFITSFGEQNITYKCCSNFLIHLCAFAGWNSPLDQSKFEFVKGRDQLKEYFHTPNKARVFCQQCGSPIYSYRTDLPNVIRLRLGTVTEGHIPAPTEEFFTEHKPKFIEVR